MRQKLSEGSELPGVSLRRVLVYESFLHFVVISLHVVCIKYLREMRNTVVLENIVNHRFRRVFAVPGIFQENNLPPFQVVSKISPGRAAARKFRFDEGSPDKQRRRIVVRRDSDLVGRIGWVNGSSELAAHELRFCLHAPFSSAAIADAWNVSKRAEEVAHRKVECYNLVFPCRNHGWIPAPRSAVTVDVPPQEFGEDVRMFTEVE